MIAWLRCLWSGHQDVYQFERSRVTLRCLVCGRESSGWQLDDLRPPVRSRP